MANLGDIRAAADGRYWQTFEAKWTSLLSYRYLGRQVPDLDAGAERHTMPLRHDMRNAIGGVMAAPLCIASPECGGFMDDVCVPNPVVASMQIVDDAHGVKQVDIVPDIVHTGRYMGFSRALIVDAEDHSRIIAVSEGQGVTLGPAPGSYEKVENPPLDIVDSPDLPPLHEVFGAHRRSTGVWELPELMAELASPDAALHLGPQHIVLETAATELAAAKANTDRLQIDSWHVMFVSRGKVGPFRAAGTAYSGNDTRIACRVQLFDEGNGDRVITIASALFHRAD